MNVKIGKAQLKQLRAKFNEAVFRRDKSLCRMCDQPAVDAHHITDRHDMPADGYAVENGIALCSECHIQAEEFHRCGVPVAGYAPHDLYEKIGSSMEIATKACLRLEKIAKQTT